MSRKTYSPKEFSAWLAENDIRRSAEWVREQCSEFVRTKGRRGIAVIFPSGQYLIPDTECARFRRPCSFARVARVA